MFFILFNFPTSGTDSPQHLLLVIMIAADEVLVSRVGSAVKSSRYGSPDLEPQSAVDILNTDQLKQGDKSPSRFDVTKGSDDEMVNDASEEETDDPTLFVSPLSNKALLGVAK